MKTFSITDIGLQRTTNQDNVFCDENAIGCFPNLFIVADGMGGHNAGDYASKLAVEAIRDSISDSRRKTPVSILEEAIQCANMRILNVAKENPDYLGMGTTLVVAVIIEHILYIANIGDSRLYLIRDGIKQITEDHSYVEEMVKSGKIAKENMRSHPKKNVITRALGIRQKAMPDYFELDLLEGDFVLLCSDGLTNMVEDEGIVEIIKSKDGDVQKSAVALKDKANELGGKDNVSIILIRV